MERYKEQMLKGHGITCVVLVGQSDLEFLVEWCAEKAGLSFRLADDLDSVPCERTDGTVPSFIIAGEKVPMAHSSGPNVRPVHHWDLHLANLVLTPEQNVPMPEDLQ